MAPPDPFLAGHGFRVIVPDMRGLGALDRPPEVADYALAKDRFDDAGPRSVGNGHGTLSRGTLSLSWAGHRGLVLELGPR